MQKKLKKHPVILGFKAAMPSIEVLTWIAKSMEAYMYGFGRSCWLAL